MLFRNDTAIANLYNYPGTLHKVVSVLFMGVSVQNASEITEK